MRGRQKNSSILKGKGEISITKRATVANVHSLGALCLGAAKTPMYMQNRENSTGIKNAGATLLIILTPPNTMKQSRIVTTTP